MCHFFKKIPPVSEKHNWDDYPPLWDVFRSGLRFKEETCETELLFIANEALKSQMHGTPFW